MSPHKRISHQKMTGTKRLGGTFSPPGCFVFRSGLLEIEVACQGLPAWHGFGENALHAQACSWRRLWELAGYRIEDQLEAIEADCEAISSQPQVLPSLEKRALADCILASDGASLSEQRFAGDLQLSMRLG